MRQYKFLVDSMLGKLARFLRIFGYDTVYANDLEVEYDIVPLPDDILLEHAVKSKRIVVTRDLLFYKKAKEHIVYVEGSDVYDYLKQLREKLGLNYDYNANLARCSLCNSELNLVKDLSSVKDQVNEQTLAHVKEFYQCENKTCGKVFWKASHIHDILQKLRNKGLIESD